MTDTRISFSKDAHALILKQAAEAELSPQLYLFGLAFKDKYAASASSPQQTIAPEELPPGPPMPSAPVEASSEPASVAVDLNGVTNLWGG